jgi:hypothetical protein
MATCDYRDALRAADAQAITLPVDEFSPGPTPWDPTLRDVFDRERRIVHQERLLPALIREPLG